MMRILCLLCLLLTTAIARPQQAGGTLEGSILDPTGAVIPRASVTVSSTDGSPRSVVSDAEGHYVVRGLRPGEYAVSASSPGFMQPKPARVHIGSNPARLNISLHVVADEETITVNGSDRLTVSTEPGENASATHITGNDLQAISDDPDDLITDIQTIAGPSAGLNGAQVYIDGLTAGDATLPDKSSIQEIRLNQNPFAPEFESMGLGRIELLTKAGTDAYHATAFFNYGNDALNSRNPYALEKPPFDLKQYGGSFSGPFNRKLSYFFDINKRDIGNGAVVNAVTVDPTTFQIVDPFTQVFSSPFRFLRVSPRVDYKITPKQTLMLRYGYTKNDYDHYGVGSFDLVSRGAAAHLREHAVQATETAILTPKIVSETQFLFLHQHHTHQADTTGPTLEVENAFSGGPDPETFSSYIHHHYQVQNITTVGEKSHTIRFGARLRAVSMIDTSEENFGGTFTFGGAFAPVLDASDNPTVPGISCNANGAAQAGCTTISSIEQYRRTLVFQKQGLSATQIRQLGGGATQFSLNTGQTVAYVGGIDFSVFVGDDWHIRPDLTLSYGLRFETQTNISDHADFAPRLGFAWSPKFGGKASKTVLRGGFGLFYDRFSELNVTTAQRYNGIAQQQYLVSNPDFYPNIPQPSALAPSAGSQVIQTISPSMRAPYLIQSMMSAERQLPGNSTVTLSYVNSHGLHQLRTRNINAPLPGTYNGTPGSGIFPYPNQGSIYEMESAGLYNQNELVVNVNSRVNKNVSLFGSYTLNSARSNTDGLSTFPANQYDFTGEYGPAEDDVRHRGSLGGSITPLWGVRFNPLIVLQTGPPFDIITSQNIYGTGILNARPGFATDASLPGVIATRYGLLDPNPTEGERILSRNYGRGPGQFLVNLRVGRDFAFGEHGKAAGKSKGFLGRPYTLTTSASVRNLLNHLNPGPIIGNVNSTLFGESNAIAPGTGAFQNSANNRRVELQVQVGF